MLVSPGKNSLTYLFKEVTVFKVMVLWLKVGAYTPVLLSTKWTGQS